MFSALRKLASNNKNEPGEKVQTAGGLQTMSASLQKKFAKGVHYNSNNKFSVVVCHFPPSCSDDFIVKF